MSQEGSPSGRPNILILYADDLGYGDLGCYNPASKIPTPHLDRLAREGVLFTDGHSSSGICTPSRYALLTGRYHWRKFHSIVSTFEPSVFSPEELTLPEMLQADGYTTAAIGKWHLGWDWSSILREDARKVPYRKGKHFTYGPEAFDWSKPIADGPLAHGFDSYFGDAVINFPPYAWIENDRVVGIPSVMADTSKFKPVEEATWEARPGPMVEGWDPYENLPTTTRRGVELIHELAGKEEPFFLYFAFPSPHAPIIPNEEFAGKSKAGPYGDYVVETDEVCGELLRALEEADVAEKTLVIFSSDNGAEWFAYPREERFGHWSSHPLRGVKQDLYEGGHRVPLIVRWPGVVDPGSVSDALVSQIDIMATLAAALGIKLPPDQATDSQNLLPILEGKSNVVRTSLVHNTKEGAYAIRNRNWLLIDADTGYTRIRDHQSAWEKKNNYPEDNDVPVELYDLGEDIAQRCNLAASHPGIVKELQELLQQVREKPSSARQ